MSSRHSLASRFVQLRGRQRPRRDRHVMHRVAHPLESQLVSTNRTRLVREAQVAQAFSWLEFVSNSNRSELARRDRAVVRQAERVECGRVRERDRLWPCDGGDQRAGHSIRVLGFVASRLAHSVRNESPRGHELRSQRDRSRLVVSSNK